jgi:prephenate dehydrogenase
MFNEPRLHTIGLIGGTGLMGRWFRPFFEKAGYQILISGRTTPLTYQECIAQSDAVIINVPISHTIEVIHKLGHFFRPGQLMVDNTSIKTQPVAAMLEVAPEGAEVLGMHTVFGPAITELRRQNVIFTSTSQSGELAQEFEEFSISMGRRSRTPPRSITIGRWRFIRTLSILPKSFWPRCCAHNSALPR